MAFCFYDGVSNRGNQIWGRWFLNGIRYSEDDDEFYEKIKSVSVVDKLSSN